MENYAEGLLVTEYQANVRQRNTLAAFMDETIRIEGDLATPGCTVVTSGENREWEG